MSHQMITETCFFVPPRSASRKRKRKHVTDLQRRQVLEADLKRFHNDVEAIFNGENAALIKEISSIMQRPVTIGRDKKLICGLIICGGESDTDRLYKHLSSKLTSNPRNVFIDLDATDCNNLKSALRGVIQATIITQSPIKSHSKVQNHDMRLIEAWHAHQNLAGGEKITIFVALRHIERFQRDVINQLVEHLALFDFDFRFICSISSTLGQLENVLTTKTVRKLEVHNFGIHSNEHTLDKIIMQQLIENQGGLRLGFEAYNALWTDYYTAHRSVDLFMSALKYAKICNTYTNHLASIEALSPEGFIGSQLDTIRSLPSFRQFVSDTETCDNIDRLHLVRGALETNSSMTALVRTFFTDIEEYKRKLCHAFRCFLIIKDNSKASIRARSVAELYKNLLKDGLHQSNAAKELLMSIRVMRKENLSAILHACETSAIELKDSDAFRSFIDEMNYIIQMPDGVPTKKATELRRLALGFAGNDQNVQEVRELRSEYEQVSLQATRDSLVSRKAVVETTKIEMTEKERRFTALVDTIHDHFASLFASLTNHEHLPLHELFWFNIDRNHKAAFSPDIRLHLRSALTDHETFLGETEIEPHTSALFRLFRDAHQLINLYDWFQAFKQVYSPNVVLPDDQLADQGGQTQDAGGEDEDEDDEEKHEEIQQALFVRSLAELKFLGLFKSTKRKTDHVQKTITIL